jgi:N-ethylmaleimide reductase
MQAGFDGVELHGAFGYLIDQFLQDGSNQRTDQYGGSIENRARFLLEVVAVVCQVWGSDRVGIKISPSNRFYGIHDSNSLTTFSYTLEQLNPFKLAYVHLMEPNADDLKTSDVINPVISTFRPFYSGLIITNGGYDKSKGNQILETGQADLVSFGQLFIANPDLPARFGLDVPLNDLNFAAIYSKSDQNLEQGYTDYPRLEP